MKYFRVPAIGTGQNDDSEQDGIRPDLPPGLGDWGGEPNGDGTFMIAVRDDSALAADAARILILEANVDTEARGRGLRARDVRRWWIPPASARGD